ncbi:MAG: GTPase RsgA [Ruminococcus sp.]
MSNLDQIFFVTSTCHPTPNLLLLDSFLTVAIYQDIQPAVILTKVDLDRGEKLESLYADAGIPVYLVDYMTSRRPSTMWQSCWTERSA